MKKLLLAALMAALLSACSDRPAKVSVEDVGEFDGCTVKFVDRGSNTNSFFLAKCNSTATTTKNYSTGGKAPSARRVTTVTTVEEIKQ